MIPFSVLDLSPIVRGNTATDAFRNTLALAQHAEKLGFKRFWLAEHHNNPGIASAATAVVIGHVAGGTKTIRVGSGGVMLPNHSPLVIAEQFGTLESLYPGRIDLGLGRAPGTDQLTARALRRDHMNNADTFPQDVEELRALFGPVQPGQRIRAVPGAGLGVPLWILGSSLFGAQLAAMLGLPFGFASHFAPDMLMQALDIYRDRFQPSAQLAKPHAMVVANVVAADTDEAARYQFTSVQQSMTNLLRGAPGMMQPPIDDIDSYWSPSEKAGAQRMLRYAISGSPSTVENRLRSFIAETAADELMVTSHLYDPTVARRSLEIVAQARDALGSQGRAAGTR
ncbi:MAG: LLM class flavin-dependent oxidoreductase [Polaromonas sp.]|uniref:LLM class flavin-dependent oxidoreductase n=1 Tax=Polaromonas sp. TaxID=1869339 RepID=UPI0025D93DA0|nr:LLM class flavin-dependent oxidoreductase [Polaromonas sp.]MBI2729091.1 LLM class flavin-dependent oxidoreductase [Polaromonas sp.]